MLRELKIENLAIIDELDIEFEKGFIVLNLQGNRESSGGV